MRRYLVIATVAVVLLVLVFLGGVWVGTNQDPWTYFSGDQTAGSDDQLRVEPEALDEPATPGDEQESLDDDLDTGHEPERKAGEPDDSEPHRVDNPPDPVDLGEEGEAEPANEEDEEEGVYATTIQGQPEIGVGNAASDKIDPFIVSTLEEETRTWWHHSLESSLSTPLIKKSKDSALNYTYSDPLPDFPYLLIGSVELPEIDREDELILKAAHRTRVTVSSSLFPELYSTVEDGHFALHITETEAEMYRGDGLVLRVHSPAFSMEKGARYVVVSKSTHSPLTLKLQRTQPFVLTINVTPPEAIEQGVYVWSERLGEEEYGEDSVFMRSNVPSSGRLHFVFSAPYGVLRVGASGERWHSGLPRVVRRTPDQTHATINLELAHDYCDRVTGTITQDMDAWKDNAVENLKPVKAARLTATHFGTISYSDEEGNFEIWAPTANTDSLRQLLVSRHLYPQEVIPLEARAEASANVDYGVGGRAVYGPWSVRLQRWTKLTIDWRPDPELETARLVPGSGMYTDEVNDRREKLYPVRWGERFFYYRSGPQETVHQVFMVRKRDWATLTQQRFQGERFRELNLESLKDVIEDRDKDLARHLKRK